MVATKEHTILITPDFSEIADDLAPGTYNVRVEAAETGEYKTGTKYIKWTLGTIGSDEPKDNGRKLWHNTIYAGKGAFMFKKFLNAATNGEAKEGEMDTEQLLGKELTVVAALNDRGYLEVKSVRPITG